MSELIEGVGFISNGESGTSLLSGKGAQHRTPDLDLAHLRSLANWRQDDKALNFAFLQDDEQLKRLDRQYLILASLLRAASERAEDYMKKGSSIDLEKLVEFCAIILSHAEIPVKAPAAPPFQDFLTAAILWFRSLRNSIYVDRFWDSIYAMLS